MYRSSMAGSSAKRKKPDQYADDERSHLQRKSAQRHRHSTRLVDLPLELVAEIHRRLGFVDRLNTAMVLGNRVLSAEAPCLVLPDAEAAERATLFSLADGAVGVARAPDPTMRDHVVLGSSGGWVVTADARGALRMANPVTSEQAELPRVTDGTIPIHGRFTVDMRDFAKIRFAGGEMPAEDDRRFPLRGTFTHSDWQMRQWFYRKVVLSASPRPHKNSYAAMLILAEQFGAPAFATADDPVWRLAPSRDGVEDEIHRNGRFYSVTYTGTVEAWERHAQTGEYRRTAVGPKLPAFKDTVHLRRRKYIAAAPDGRLMAVVKESKKVNEKVSRYCLDRELMAPAFKVLVLDEPRGQWVETRDIGDAAVFVGVNNSLCVSTTKCNSAWIRAGCVYYTDDEPGKASLRLELGKNGEPIYRSSMDDESCDYELRDLGVYSLKDGTVGRVQGLPKHRCWPPPAWFTPSV